MTTGKTGEEDPATGAPKGKGAKEEPEALELRTGAGPGASRVRSVAGADPFDRTHNHARRSY